MDYKKLYEEALERAKEFICKDNVKVAEYIFPELKESEDERIRKELLEHCKNQAKPYIQTGNKCPQIQSWIAWLEKQGETFIKKDVDDAYLKGVTDTKNEIEKQYEANYQIRKDIATFIFNYRGNIKDRAKWIDYLGIKVSFVKMQGEQKSADKFKVGDWIIFAENHNSVYQVERIDNYRYYLRHYLGGTLSVHFDNELIRHWTIQDAKDGDVLSWDDSKCIALFKNIYDEESFNSYGLVGHCTGAFELRQSYHDIEGAHPATKEQRDLLFQKMNEAGYEWDNEKKELKKIEQKSADKIEPIFNVGDKIQYLRGCGTIMTIEKIENGEYIFANNIGHTTIENGNKCYLVEQKLAWSEEDELHIRELESLVKQVWGKAECENDKDTILKMRDLSFFLKTLNPSKRQKPAEWSEEDEKMMDIILNDINYAQKNFSDSKLTSYDKKIEWLKNTLKSLRPQSQWKPSIAQLNALSIVSKGNSTDDIEAIVSLYQDLKKLREE